MRIVPPNQSIPEADVTSSDGGPAAGEPAEPSTPAEPRPAARASLAQQATSHANLVGHVLADRYRLLKLIGEGGMGSVYQAEHITIGRKLAVKVLAQEYCDSPEVVARFLQEARTASMLHHEHIVDITDFGHTKQGLAFLTMEYLEGEDLATLLSREGRQPWARLRRIILQVCRALHAAHEKGIVHRDMKPDNCFRIKRGGNPDFIKILDFGIAKVLADGQFGGREDRPKMATEAGTLLGTPEYMAPEIARDQKADARVDVYSLGILIYEMLTGSVPFKGQTFMATVAMQMVDEPMPPRQRAPEAEIPIEIEAVIMTALQKDPDQRYQSVRELAEAIIEADAALRATSTGLPALRFESGEYAATTSSIHPGDSSLIRTSTLTSSDSKGLASSGAWQPLRTPPGTGSQPVVNARISTPAPSTPSGAPSIASEVTPDLDDGSGMTRPNPYRALSVMLLLVVAGLGAAIWYLLGRVEPDPEPGPGGEHVVVPSDPIPVPTIPVDPKNGTSSPTADPAHVEDPEETPGKHDKGGKKTPPAPVIEATNDEKQAYIGTLIGDVSRCATASELPRQNVVFLLESEASTGKVRANLESPLGNAAFTSCAEKAIAKRRFKKSRKHVTFRATLQL